MTTKIFDRYCVDVSTLQEARATVEAALATALRLHESTYAGGEYYRSAIGQVPVVSVRPNRNSFSDSLVEAEAPECQFVVIVEKPPEPEKTKAALLAAGLRFLRRTEVTPPPRRVDEAQLVQVRAADAVARSLPGVGFQLRLDPKAMRPRVLVDAGWYMVANGAQGSGLSFAVAPTELTDASPDALLDAASALLGQRGKTIIHDRSELMVSGKARPAVGFVVGAGNLAIAKAAVAVPTAAGTVLVLLSTRAGTGAPPSVQDIAALPEIGMPLTTFEIVEVVAPAAGPWRRANVINNSADIAASLEGPSLPLNTLLGLKAEAMMAAVFTSGRPSVGIGVTCRAFVEQLRAAGVPPEALEMCIVVWSSALDGLDVGPVPGERLARLDQSIGAQTQGLAVLERWMKALRANIASAENLDEAIQFLLRSRTTWALMSAPGPVAR